MKSSFEIIEKVLDTYISESINQFPKKTTAKLGKIFDLFLYLSETHTPHQKSS